MPSAYTVIKHVFSLSSQTCKHFAKYTSTSIMAAFISEVIRTEEAAGKFEFFQNLIQNRRFSSMSSVKNKSKTKHTVRKYP